MDNNSNFLEKIRMAEMFRPERRYEYEDDYPYGEPRRRNNRSTNFGPPISPPREQQLRPPEVPYNQMVSSGSIIPPYAQERQVANTAYQPSMSSQIQDANTAERLSPTPLTELQERELALQEQQIKTNAGMKQQQLEINKRKADIQDFKAKNPNLKIVVTKGGRVQAISPLNGQVVADLGDSGILSDEDKITLTAESQQGLEGIRQEGRIDIEDKRQQGRETIVDIEARHRRELEGVRSNQPLSEIDKGRGFQNKYNIFINQHPELRKFVKLNADGVPEIIPPQTGGMFEMKSRKPTQEQYNAIKEFIFGETAQTPKVELTPKVTNPGIRVRDPETGKTGTYQGTAAEAIKEGFEVVGQ